MVKLMAKSARGLIDYCIAQLGRPYYTGGTGHILTEDKYKDFKANAHWDSDTLALYEADYKSQIGQKVHDCSGLIKGYCWTSGPDAGFKGGSDYQSNGCEDCDVDTMESQCTNRHSLTDTSTLVPGALLFNGAGHVGVYVGAGKIVEARSHILGVCLTDLKERMKANPAYPPMIRYGLFTPAIDYSDNYTEINTPIRAITNSNDTTTDQVAIVETSQPASGTKTTSAVVPIEYDAECMAPYIAVVSRNYELNYEKAKENRIFGCIFEAGKLFDTRHNRLKVFASPKIDKQCNECVAANMPYGLYFQSNARTETEAKEEIYYLSFILNRHPPKLGVWIDITSYSKDYKSRNNKILDVYKTRLWDLGLKENIGLYAKTNIYDIIDWKAKSLDWLLWLYKPVTDIKVLDNNITPSFFKV